MKKVYDTINFSNDSNNSTILFKVDGRSCKVILLVRLPVKRIASGKDNKGNVECHASTSLIVE